MRPTFPIRRRPSPTGRHPLVYLAAFSLMFSLVAFFARAGVFYVAAGTVAAVVLAGAAIAVALRGRADP
ncbi:MAG: hypothetical protein WD773_12985 [Gemmatimonadales bacterium]